MLDNVIVNSFLPALKTQLLTNLAERVQLLETMPNEVERTLLCSRYCQKLIQAKTIHADNLLAWHQDLTTGGSLTQAYFTDYFSQALKSCMALLSQGQDAQVELLLEECLRQARQYFMLRWIHADANRLLKPESLVHELSLFAASCLDMANTVHYALLAKRFGVPIAKDTGTPVNLVILAMGKLGAMELNLSSDIDLIFSYSEAGETEGVNGRQKIDNQQFFHKLGQKLIKSIDQATVDGYVFRVDMRLRPWGQSGSLALSFDAMEFYYEQHGREWERFAMIKARPIAGDVAAGDALILRLKPFVYRRYTDFSGIQALRDMKAMINREVQRQGKQSDVKLGRGGIREVEFIAQAFQIIYGGKDELLQQRSVIRVLEHLERVDVLAKNSASQLTQAYWFLRCCEHAIQALDDQQTQKLPDDEETMARFLHYLSIENSDVFFQKLDLTRALVRDFFEEVVAEPGQELDATGQEAWRLAWLDSEIDSFVMGLQELGLSLAAAEHLKSLRFSSKLNQVQSESLDRLNAFMPYFMQRLSIEIQFENQATICDSILTLVFAVLRRSAYLVLLQENPGALAQLFTVAKASPWVLQQMVQQPVLLDELLSSSGLGQVPDVNSLQTELRQQSLRVEVADLEEQMQMLRYFKLAHHVHIVAAEAGGKLPLMKVSDYLTWLAEAIVRYVLDIAFAQMVAKHGYPCVKGVRQERAEFAIIGYGKLGGIELSHSSDLDLVFLYEADDLSDTDGENSINNRTFFSRLGQRILSILNTRTMLGQLYEIDMRLRPSGGKGLLVSSVKAFEKYQRESAWTWEHQALVRARAVAGSPAVIEAFNQIRANILSLPREKDKLVADVVAMRQKMADNLIPAEAKKQDSEIFHLKHSRGGMVDIEFMVQYSVLAHAAEYPELLRYTDNIRIIETLAEVGLVTLEACQTAIDAYQSLRAKGHALALKEKASLVPVSDVKSQRDTVYHFWQTLFHVT